MTDRQRDALVEFANAFDVDVHSIVVAVTIADDEIRPKRSEQMTGTSYAEEYGALASEGCHQLRRILNP